MKLYGGHPMDARFDFRQWELQLESDYEIEIVNPFYDINRDDIVAIDEERKDRFDTDSKQIVFRDVGAIQDCIDGMIAYLPPDAEICGTFMEMVYANMLNRDVYTVCTNGNHNHPWIKEHSYDIFTSKEEFAEWLDLNV
jgi:hypothetical protein